VGELAQLDRRLLGMLQGLGQQVGQVVLLVLQGAVCPWRVSLPSPPRRPRSWSERTCAGLSTHHRWT
jgi:hypothetical protein